MADKTRYPQIPSTVWWGIRNLINKTPGTIFDERTLSIQLDVQPVAAKQYIGELTVVGILNEEGRATPRALKWRLNDTYHDAVDEMMAAVYPQSLLDLAPPADNDRQKATTWFQQEGLGLGAAGNKAATYFLLGSTTPGESPRKQPNVRTAEGTKQPSSDKSPITATVTRKVVAEKKSRTASERNFDSMPLNVNVQIHISADAGSEQIESIFSAMRRYLNDQQNS